VSVFFFHFSQESRPFLGSGAIHIVQAEVEHRARRVEKRPETTVEKPPARISGVKDDQRTAAISL
jgi:hypothetical protein